MKLDKRLLVAIFAAAAAVTFVLTGRRGNDGAAAKDADEKRRKRKKALNLTMRVQIQNLINTQKMIEAVIGAVREYIRVKKSKAQIKGAASNAPQMNMLTSTLPPPASMPNTFPVAQQAQIPSYGVHTESSNETKRLKPWERKRQNPSSSSFMEGNSFSGYQPAMPSSFSTFDTQDQGHQEQIQPQIPGIVTSHV